MSALVGGCVAEVEVVPPGEATAGNAAAHVLALLGTIAQPSPDVTVARDEVTGGWVYGAGGGGGEAEWEC